MTRSDQELDPQLKEMLDVLRPVPQRNPQSAAGGRAQFLSQAREIGQAVSKSKKWRHIGWFGSIFILFHKKELKPMFTTLISSLVVFVLAFGGSVVTAYAAQDDLPGDTLYAVKVFTEDARLALASDVQDVTLYEEFAQRRIQEAVQLSDSSRFDDIEAAMVRYEVQLQALNQTLVRLAAEDPARADALAAQMQATLTTQLQTLTQLREQVADPARGSIDEAVKRSREQAGSEFAGLVETIGTGSWVIAGRALAVTLQTEIKGEIAVGSLVKVHAYQAPDGTLTAGEIEVLTPDTLLEFTGYVDTITDASWTVSGQAVAVNQATEIRGDVQVGDWVVVKVLVAADGTLTALAIHIPGSDDFPGNGNGNDGDDDDANDNSNGNGNDSGDDNNSNDNGNDSGGDDNGNGSDDGNANDSGGGDDNANDNDSGDDDNGNANDNGSDDGNANDNDSGDDDNGNANDNGSDDGNANDNGSDDGNANDNDSGDDDNGNANDNGSDDGNANDSGGGDDNANDNDSGSDDEDDD